MPEVIDIQVTDWDKEVASSELPVIVEYWHQKCVSCLQMLPIYKQLPDRIGDRVKLTRMNILDSRENRIFAIEQGIRGTPTFSVYCGGRPIGEVVGVRTLEELEQEILSLVKIKDSCLLATPLTEE
jgi:thioredoxin 1